MRIKIAVRQKRGSEKYMWKSIDAEPITIKGYEDFKFFYHDSQELFTCWPKVIAEKTCGCMVSEGKNKRECIKNALANLHTVSKDEFRNMIAKKLKLIKPIKKKAK